MMTRTLPFSVQALTDAIEQAEFSDEQANAMSAFLADLIEATRNGKLAEVERKEFRNSLGLSRIFQEPTLTQLSGVVLPAKSDSIKKRVDGGEYQYKNSNINGTNFSVTLDAGIADLWLAHFGVDVQTEEVEAWAAAHGYEVAFVEELLAVGSHPEHRKLQLEFSIIALGSSAVVNGGVSVPFLDGGGSGRKLFLYCRDYGWLGGCRFLLRKISLPLAT